MDKVIMDTSLCYLKNVCNLLMHGVIESKDKKIKDAFMDALDEYLDMQGVIYAEMERAGLYKVEDVDESKILKTANKHNCTLKES